MPTHKVVSEYAPVESDGSSNIKVYVRARPCEDKSEPSFITLGGEDSKQITIKDPDGAAKKKYGEVSFIFDRIFWTDVTQDEVFKTICKPQVDHVLKGYNCCSFAYGQTGSGKTYSMFGEGEEIRGIIPRSVEYLFQCLNQRSSAGTETAMVCSFLEIYNDAIRDLGKAYLVAMGVENSNSSALYEKTSDIFESLVGKRGNPYFAPAFHKATSTGAPTDGETMVRPGLKEVHDEYNAMNYEIREDTEGNVFVKDLSLVPVTTIEEVMTLINQGLRVRATHETKMNATSSRSHTVFAITVLQKEKLSGNAITGVLNLVDLAGSERLKKSESVGIRLKEAVHINTSLTALGKVIMSLDPSSEMSHIPYRDSKLTRVLQNSLGGNSYTAVLAQIHPMISYYDECLSTLQFANRCKNVRNNPRVNYVEDNEDKDKKIKRLLEEIKNLQQKLALAESKGRGGGDLSMAKVLQMLKKAGVPVEIGSDGGLLLNGVAISAEELMADSDSLAEGSQLDAGGGGKSSKGGGLGGIGGGFGGNERTKRMISDLQEQNRSLTAKSKEKKIIMEEQGKQIQDMSNEIVRCQTTIKHKEYEYKMLLEEKERAVAEVEATLKKNHAFELEDVISNNKAVINRQQTALQNAPDTIKAYTQLLRKAGEAKTSFEGPLRQEFERHLVKLETSRVSEISMIKQQYEHWLREKDSSLEEFVKKFNDYRKKKSEQLRMAEKEIVRLYSHTEQLEVILDGVEKGVYLVQQRQGSQGKTTTGMGANTEMGAVVLPKGLRPVNPLKTGDEKLLLTKKIVEKHNEREKKLDKLKEEAFNKSLQFASQASVMTMGPVDPILQQQIRDLLVAPTSVKKPTSEANRPSTAGANNQPSKNDAKPPMTAPGRSRSDMSGDERERLAYSAPQSSHSNNVTFEIDGENKFDTMNDITTLRTELMTLKAEKEMTLENIANELSSNETVAYIKHMEAETEKQRQTIKALGTQLQNLKVANAALQRKVGKS